LRKQGGKEPPKSNEPPKIFTSFKELEDYLENLSVEELEGSKVASKAAYGEN